MLRWVLFDGFIDQFYGLFLLPKKMKAVGFVYRKVLLIRLDFLDFFDHC